jgi:hypothetical protein
MDEYGGTLWNEDLPKLPPGQDPKAVWGYGKRVESKEEALERIRALTAVLTSHPHIAGYCYTQLTDVEQEQNGVYTYDRKLKFDAEELKRIFGAPAAIESEEQE